MDNQEMNFGDDYNILLYDVIPHLKKFSSCCGSEGRAYFLNDDLVVKEYLSANSWDLFDSVFNHYCAEMSNFSKMGLSVPKIYSYTKIPNMEHYTKGKENKYRYYILEERVKGREFYTGYLEDAYSVAKDICSKEEFKNAVKQIEDIETDKLVSDALVEEVLTRYFQDYVLMNEMIESMSENDYTKFLMDAHTMFIDGKFSCPDLFPLNIFVFDGKLKLIDAHVKEQPILYQFDTSDYVKDMINLFLYNYFVTNPDSVAIKNRVARNPKLQQLSAKNRTLCKQVYAKTLGIINKNCDNAVKNMKEYDRLLSMVTLSAVLDKEGVEEINKTFLQ